MLIPKWTRRSFLKASVVATLTLCGGNVAWARELVDDKLPVGRLSLFNTHTEERLDVTYRDAWGEYDQSALDAINWLLRCHYSDEVKQIDLRTIEYLSLVDQTLGGDNEIHVISGYRSPRYNQLLRQRGRNVAKHSLHMEGKAIDIRMPTVKLASLRQAALGLRYGGLGYYPRTGFVHLDSGDFRTW